MAAVSDAPVGTSETKGLVVITGASSGIGAETAKAYSKLGHPLLLLARRLERMEEMKLPKAMCRKVDVTDLKAISAAVEEAEKEYGPTYIFINNAGLMQLGSVMDQDPAEWEAMMRVNVLGALNGSRAVVKGMCEREDGVIVNVSSIAGRKAFGNHAAYCATKFGVHAFSEVLRTEVCEKGVRVVVISPGVVETELLSHSKTPGVIEGYEAWKKEGLKSKALVPKDVADAIIYASLAPKHVCVREVCLGPTFQED